MYVSHPAVRHEDRQLDEREEGDGGRQREERLEDGARVGGDEDRVRDAEQELRGDEARVDDDVPCRARRLPADLRKGALAHAAEPLAAEDRVVALEQLEHACSERDRAAVGRRCPSASRSCCRAVPAAERTPTTANITDAKSTPTCLYMLGTKRSIGPIIALSKVSMAVVFPIWPDASLSTDAVDPTDALFPPKKEPSECWLIIPAPPVALR
mmetsp:Transcript_35500/g.114497  ORF Transcript_35500/g.114497 Transcript_35500/m.114497 type:complete len:212 (+) Transcript_35500:934-1569(+)